jgi:two-component system LytT family response regulator
LKAVIIDDEKPACENLKHYLKEYPIEIAGVAKNLTEAVQIIKEVKPGVVFLDINLSGENGFDLFDKVEAEFKTIFVTAYDSFALRAFEVNALDYLLKPLVKERIASAMARLFDSKEEIVTKKRYTMEDTIFLSNGTKACFSKLKDISHIEAESCYSRVYFVNKESKIVPQTLKKWETVLPENEFIRVHRTFIINSSHIKEIKKRINGTYLVFLHNGKEPIEISRRYASNLKKNSIL